MVGLMLGITLVVVAALIAVNAISIRLPELSQFELDRRHRSGDKKSELLLKKSNYLTELTSLQRIISSLLLVIAVSLLVAIYGWLIGVLLSLLLALEYGAIARLAFVRRYAQTVYEKYEGTILNSIARYPKLFFVLKTVTTAMPPARISSKDELLHMVSGSGVVLSEDEKLLIKNGVSFEGRIVREIMMPRSVIDSIEKSEILGPLVLDDLHKAGHNRFVVTDTDLDHTVGILHIRDLLTLDSHKKKTLKVEQAMEPRVFYIHEDQTLAHALAAFLTTHHHLFVVVNEYRETVGIVCLEDVIETLLGRTIIDEFDTHEDLRAVAGRNPRGNNTAKNSTDV